MSENNICLNMIVKNESRIIERCIKSVYHLIDTWCIVDTGSTDGTQEIIKELLKDKPGELIEKPWVNFGHNRNEALRFAEKWGEWTFLIDADMVLIDNGFDKSKLNPNVCGYDVIQDNHGTRYYNSRLLNSSKHWECIGVTHEYYSPKEGLKYRDRIDTLHFNDIGDGGSKSDKFTRDITLLKQGLINEPKNCRYMFYLGQTYRDIGEYENAIIWYQKCSEESTWDEEKFYATYMVGWCMCNEMGKNQNSIFKFDEIVLQLTKAWSLRPWRIEPLFQLGIEYKNRKMWQQAYSLLKICSITEYPKSDILFVQSNIYEGMSLDEFSIASYYFGKYDESSMTCRQLLSQYLNYSNNNEKRIKKNLWYSEKELGNFSTEKMMNFLKSKKRDVDMLMKLNNYQI
jgi:glycosyltransferase involved in cell wall biosynthesis